MKLALPAELAHGYVALPQDFFLHKTNEATFVTLRKNGDRIDVVAVR